MIVNPLQLVLLGARLADPSLKDLIPNEVFSGELAELVAPPQETFGKRLWDWLKSKGVRRVESEKPIEAIARVMREDRDRYKRLSEIRGLIRENKSSDISGVSELRELLDRFLPHSDPNKPQ